MSRKFHRTLFIIFLLVFVVAAPILILYTGGYRYDFKKRKLVKMGNILIDSIPSDAKIYLNGELQKQRLMLSMFPYKKLFGWQKLGGTTPAIISNLTPNEYLIEIKKTDYQTWTKKLSVQPGLTTFARNTFLFLENSKIEKIIGGNIELLSLAPNHQKIAYTIRGNNKVEIKILNLNNLESKPLIDLFTSASQIDWDWRSEKILVTTPNDYFILDSSKTNYILSLKKLLGFKPEKVHWTRQNNNLIFISYGNFLYEINLTSLTFRPKFNFNYLSTGKIIDWQLEQNQISYIKLRGGQAYLEINELDKEKIEPVSLELPYSNNYQLVKTKSQQKKITTLLDKENSKLLLIDLTRISSEEAILLNTEATNASWRINQLFYYNEFELWQASFAKERRENLSIEKEIINRFSQPLVSAFWHPQGDYVIFAQENQVFAIELDGRDRRNMADLVTVQDLKNVVIGQRGKYLYLIGTIEQEKGLFRITIQ